MATANMRQSFNTEIAVTGERPTDELPTAIAEKKEAKLTIVGQVESAAAQAGARTLATRTFGKKEREEKGDRETDSHDSPTAVARSIFWSRRREDKQRQTDDSPNETINDEAIGERTVEAINLDQISRAVIKTLEPFRRPLTPREQARRQLTA